MSKIYHYTSLETFAEKIFKDFKLLMNKPNLVNDPLESEMLFKTTENKDSDEFIGSVQWEIHKSRNLYNITCFSIDRRFGNITVPGWCLPKMWTHYGDNHRGVCIVINKEKLLNENHKILKYRGLVKYNINLKLPILDISEFNTIDEKKIAEEFIKQHYRNLFFQKHYDWRSEAEYRIVAFESSFCSIYNSIESVIFGVKSPRYKITGLKNMFENATKVYLNTTESGQCIRIEKSPLINFYELRLSGPNYRLSYYNGEKWTYPARLSAPSRSKYK